MGFINLADAVFGRLEPNNRQLKKVQPRKKTPFISHNHRQKDKRVVKRGYGPRMHRIHRITHRRTFISTLFGLTFFASVLTVSASDVLPCPVRPDRNYHADSERKARGGSRVVVEKRPRRWIQEKVVTEY